MIEIRMADFNKSQTRKSRRRLRLRIYRKSSVRISTNITKRKTFCTPINSPSGLNHKEGLKLECFSSTKFLKTLKLNV